MATALRLASTKQSGGWIFLLKLRRSINMLGGLKYPLFLSQERIEAVR